MAVYTGLSVGKIGVGCDFDKAVAVAAIHAKLFHVEGMGERDRLVGLIAHSAVFRGEIIPDSESDGGTRNQAANKQLERKPIGPSGKEIRHRVV